MLPARVSGRMLAGDYEIHYPTVNEIGVEKTLLPGIHSVTFIHRP